MKAALSAALWLGALALIAYGFYEVLEGGPKAIALVVLYYAFFWFISGLGQALDRLRDELGGIREELGRIERHLNELAFRAPPPE
jgi:hypothetical protein